jgi:hypothetical protein
MSAALEMRGIVMPAVVLASALSVLDCGTAAAELVAGGWLMPPRVPRVEPAPIAPRPTIVPTQVHRAPPRPRPPKRAPHVPAQPAPPSDGKVRF